MPEVIAVRAKEAAQMLGTSPSTLAHWRMAGKGPPYVRLGAKKIAYRVSDLRDWVKQSTIGGCADAA